jgi:DNA polymerase-3 subunit alpha
MKARYGGCETTQLAPGQKPSARTTLGRTSSSASHGLRAGDHRQVTGFIDYFLVVWDFIAWAKTRHPRRPRPRFRRRLSGRLPARHHQPRPIRFKLLFERFLNPERVSPPDFDIDFCMRRRGEVIDYVREKYGKDCVANIITYGTLGAKMVIRDVSRVHDLPYAEADRLAKMIPDELNISLEAAIDQERRAAQRDRQEPVAKKIIEAGPRARGHGAQHRQTRRRHHHHRQAAR